MNPIIQPLSSPWCTFICREHPRENLRPNQPEKRKGRERGDDRRSGLRSWTSHERVITWRRTRREQEKRKDRECIGPGLDRLHPCLPPTSRGATFSARAVSNRSHKFNDPVSDVYENISRARGYAIDQNSGIGTCFTKFTEFEEKRWLGIPLPWKSCISSTSERRIN